MRFTVKNRFKVLQILAVSNMLDFGLISDNYAVKARCPASDLPHTLSYHGDMFYETWYAVTHSEYSHLTTLSEIFGTCEGIWSPLDSNSTARLKKDRVFKDTEWQNVQLDKKSETRQKRRSKTPKES